MHDSPVHPALMPGPAPHTHIVPGLEAHTRTHLLSEGTLHKNPAAVSSHLKGSKQGEGVTGWEEESGGQEKGVWIPLKSPGTNL